MLLALALIALSALVVSLAGTATVLLAAALVALLLLVILTRPMLPVFCITPWARPAVRLQIWNVLVIARP
jgi:hypothetical protein